MITELADDDPRIDEVLRFWFGQLDERGDAEPAVMRRWFVKDAGFDDEIRRRFGALHAAVAAGEARGWRTTTRGALATVLVLDQLSRNMFRDTPAMFATDAQALAIAKDAVARGLDREAPRAPRAFFYLPYMHSEELADQDACVEFFRGDPAYAMNLDYAERHRAIIRRFGRFPHRNAILGRSSTPEEAAFLEEPGSSF